MASEIQRVLRLERKQVSDKTVHFTEHFLLRKIVMGKKLNLTRLSVLKNLQS